MVDESGEIASSGGVDHLIGVDAEQVRAAHALLLVVDFSALSDHRADRFADVLDDHLIWPDILQSEQSPAVDLRPAEPGRLLPKLKRPTLLRSTALLCELVRVQLALNWLIFNRSDSTSPSVVNSLRWNALASRPICA